MLLLLIGVGAWRLVVWGRKLQRGKQDAANAEIKDKQLKAALNAPRDKRDIVRELRDRGL